MRSIRSSHTGPDSTGSKVGKSRKSDSGQGGGAARWPLRTGSWRLSDGYPESHGLKVFSTFSCGGGSTMGYKLAGFKVIGCCEIDPQMFRIYTKNHDPRHGINFAIGDFNARVKANPDGFVELIGVDILDGSPPCSSFSIAGSREDAWGKKKKFREGQAEQVLDDLFFQFLDTVELLRPKVVVAENVKGMLLGDAKGYVVMVMDRFRELGYDAQIFLLNASAMGCPQARERVFFVARRGDLAWNNLRLEFNERVITTGEALKDVTDMKGAKPLEPFLAGKGARQWCVEWNEYRIEQWRIAKHGKPGYFNHVLVLPDRPAPTQTASIRHIHWAEDRRLSDLECVRLQTFPDDYDFLDADAGYVCGMSVPPFMMQRLADQIRRQWFGVP